MIKYYSTIACSVSNIYTWVLRCEERGTNPYILFARSPRDAIFPISTREIEGSNLDPREKLEAYRSRASDFARRVFSLETVSLPGRQRSHDYNAIQRIDAESWGHTRGRRRVVNSSRVRPAREEGRRVHSVPPSPPLSFPPRLLLLLLSPLFLFPWPAPLPSNASWESRYTTCNQRCRRRPTCTKSLTSLLVIFSA